MSVKLMGKSDDLHRVRWGVCVYLLNGPMTLEDIKTSYKNTPFPFSSQPGFFAKGKWNERGLKSLPQDLTNLTDRGWITLDNERFALTEQGRAPVNKIIAEARSSSDWVGHNLSSFLKPEVASKVTIAVQLMLAMIKLPAGHLSGSVGLLNDSADTILDLFFSLLVYPGIRFNKERLVSILLVVFMQGMNSLTDKTDSLGIVIPQMLLFA